MSERAHEETKWRPGELARVRGHHGHASAVRLRRQQENGARSTRTTSTFVVQNIHRHPLTISFSVPGQVFFFVVITVSVDGKETWSFRSGDFEVALGRCDVRANTVVPVLCLRLGTPRRCCTSRILSCNGVHALSCSHLCHLCLPLFLDSLYQQRRLRVATGGETLFETVCLSLSFSLSLSLSFTIEFYGKKSIRSERGYGFGAQVFFLIL